MSEGGASFCRRSRVIAYGMPSGITRAMRVKCGSWSCPDCGAARLRDSMAQVQQLIAGGEHNVLRAGPFYVPPVKKSIERAKPNYMYLALRDDSVWFFFDRPMRGRGWASGALDASTLPPHTEIASQRWDRREDGWGAAWQRDYGRHWGAGRYCDYCKPAHNCPAHPKGRANPATRAACEHCVPEYKCPQHAEKQLWRLMGEDALENLRAAGLPDVPERLPPGDMYTVVVPDPERLAGRLAAEVHNTGATFEIGADGRYSQVTPERRRAATRKGKTPGRRHK